MGLRAEGFGLLAEATVLGKFSARLSPAANSGIPARFKVPVDHFGAPSHKVPIKSGLEFWCSRVFRHVNYVHTLAVIHVGSGAGIHPHQSPQSQSRNSTPPALTKSAEQLLPRIVMSGTTVSCSVHYAMQVVVVVVVVVAIPTKKDKGELKTGVGSAGYAWRLGMCHAAEARDEGFSALQLPSISIDFYVSKETRKAGRFEILKPSPKPLALNPKAIVRDVGPGLRSSRRAGSVLSSSGCSLVVFGSLHSCSDTNKLKGL